MDKQVGLFDLFSLIVSLIISVVSIMIARVYKNRVVRYEWPHVQLACRKVALKVFNEFKPDIIFCSSGPSGMVANLMMTEANTFKPIYIGLSERSNKDDFVPPPTHTIKVSTKRWFTYLPDSLLRLKEKKLLIVEDCVVSGTTLEKLIETLIAHGFSPANIRSASLYVTKNATDHERATDYYYVQVPTDEIFLPWGKGAGNDF